MKCKCGKTIENHYRNSDDLLEKGLCFSCNIWTERYENFSEEHLVIDNTFYTLGEENAKDYFRGFGGAKFLIKRGNEIITTTNLWCGGDIPERFKTILPNTAKFIKQ